MHKKFYSHNGQDALLDPMNIEFIEERTISVYTEINAEIAANLCASLRLLSRESDDPITILINSPGGNVKDGMFIYDTLKSLKCNIRTIACGMAASTAAFLVAAGGTKGMRFIQPNAEILIHQPIGGVQGQESDILIHAQHIQKTRGRINHILAASTGQPIEKIAADTERDNIMDAQAAVDYGLVDAIIQGGI